MKLEPGMYVKTDGMSGEDYHAVAAAFMGAGAKKREYPYHDWRDYEYFGWSGPRGGLYHWDDSSSFGPNAREVTVDEVLGRDKLTEEIDEALEKWGRYYKDVRGILNQCRDRLRWVPVSNIPSGARWVVIDLGRGNEIVAPGYAQKYFPDKVCYPVVVPQPPQQEQSE